jgi:hypothetical protein
LEGLSFKPARNRKTAKLHGAVYVTADRQKLLQVLSSKAAELAVVDA